MKWTKKPDFKFALQKYQLIHFWWKRSNEWKLDLQLENQTMKITSHSKFLRTIMNRKLMWREHVNQLKMKITKSVTELFKLIDFAWKNNLLIIRRIYEAVIVSQMIYDCSVWYTSIKETNHKRWMLENLQIIQVKALRLMTEVFRITTRAALNVEIYMLSIKQRFEKLINDIMLRIMITSFYKYVIDRKFKTQNRRITSLKTLIAKFRKHTNIKARNIEKIEPFVETSWWKSSNILISKDKKKDKAKHDVHDSIESIIIK